MLKKIVLLAIIFAAPMILAQEKDAPTQHAYVGAAVCKMCHHTDKQGKQYDIWKASAHAKAYETLKTEKADKIAADKGFKTKAAATPEC